MHSAKLPPHRCDRCSTREGRADVGLIQAGVVVRSDRRREELRRTQSAPLGAIRALEFAWRFGAQLDQATLIGAVERAGYTSARVSDVKKRHAEVLARDAQGQEWELHASFDGRIRGRERSGSMLEEAGVKMSLKRSGYIYAGWIERRKRHLEVLAQNNREELVEPDIDRSGSICQANRRF